MTEKNTFGRRTWDREEYAKQAQLRREKEKKDGKEINKVEGVTHISRDSLDFSKDLNKRQVITGNVVSTRGKSFGFYCEACNLTFKDNLKFVDHLNSKPHLIRTGEVNKEVEVSLDEVKQRYETLVKKKQESLGDQEKYDIKQRIAKRRQLEEDLKKQKKQKSEEKRNVIKISSAKENNDNEENDVSKLMGFGGFGSTKK